jgi:hypothetical protein
MNNKIPFSVGEEPELQMQDLNSAYGQLTSQVNTAFKKLDCGRAKFISHEQAKSEMAERKAKIRSCT